VIGAFVTGIFLSFFRLYISPYGLFMLFNFFLVASQVLMFFIDTIPLANYIAVIIVAVVSGGSFTLAGIISHEDYGSKHYNKILGIFMTGAAGGILLFDQLVFGLFFKILNDTNNSSYKGYGKWNKYIFIICVLSSVISFIMSIGAFTRTRKRDGNKDKISDFVNF
jgi:MFS family permease